MNSKQKEILGKILEKPTRADIRWTDVKALFKTLGIQEIKLKGKTRGSRVRFEKDGIRALFHRPHPGTIVSKSNIDDIRDFLKSLGY